MRTTYRKSPIAAFASVLALLLASATAFASPLADGIGGWAPAERLGGKQVLLERLGEILTTKSQIPIKSQITNLNEKEKRGAFAVCNLIATGNLRIP
jgi:hypothetical protein